MAGFSLLGDGAGRFLVGFELAGCWFRWVQVSWVGSGSGSGAGFRWVRC